MSKIKNWNKIEVKGKRPMNSSPANSSRSTGRRTPVLALVFFLLGIAATAAWFEYGKGNLPGKRNAGLSTDALDQLRQLKSPIQIRFYSVLPSGSAPQMLQDFSQRVDHLLAEFQNVNATNIQVVRNVSPAGANADAAAADGIRPFNLDKGDACFLGIAVAAGERKESLAQLKPEWEPALPYDIIRAIQHMSAAPPAAPVPREVAKPSPEITAAIHRLIPDINAVSTKEADQIFHAEFMKEVEQASADMEKENDVAAQAVVKAQNGGSAEDLAAAKKHLLDVQIAQGEKIKRIAADLQTRLAVFQQMKNSASNGAK
jgi:hypothetical protein